MGYCNVYTTLLFVSTIFVLLPQASAFGAGDIPDFAYLNDKAFRHGDIENVLEKLAKTAGRAAGGSGFLGIAASVISAATGPSKFSKSDIKKVYFGNWLRDYSQAMDIAGLTKLSSDTLVLIVSILGFMTFGFSTEEFQVTPDRLGVYLPVEHIDNPKGYAEKEGDARNFHPKLRPPVSDRELEIDLETGMKKYMATEDQGWDTSTAFIRRTFRACIEAGRRAQGREGADLWEAYRLLGTGLHTMEDLLAHSNWCEVALRKMGHSEVFCHVGDRVVIDTPSGPAPPLVTGTFGGADFLHSLLGEAGDKLSQASVTDLSNKMNQVAYALQDSSIYKLTRPKAQQGHGPNIGALKGILSKLMGGGEADAKLSQGEQMQQQAQGYNFNPDNVCPPEVQQHLLELLKWHDDVMRQILRKIEMVPGLTSLLDEISNTLNTYIYTILAPYVTPILGQTTQVLDEGSKAVIDNHDQYEVFDNPNASDPSHSLLSKDHFGLILNEPAGKIAQIVVEHSVNLIVPAWSNHSDPDQVIDKILEAFHHPYYNSGRSEIQHQMINEMERWFGGLGSDEGIQTLEALTKEAVRDHKNKRLGSEDENYNEPGYGSCGHSGPPKTLSSGKPTVDAPSYGAEYGSGEPEANHNTGYRRQESHSYEGRQEVYGQEGYENKGWPDNTYASGRQETVGGHGGQSGVSSGYGEAASYYDVGETTHGGGRKHDDDVKPVYGGYEGRQRRDEESRPTYGGGYGGSQRQDDDEKPTYGGWSGGKKHHGEEATPAYGGGYGESQRRDEVTKPAYGGGYGQDQDDYVTPVYGYGGKRPEEETIAGGHGGDEDVKPTYAGGHGQRWHEHGPKHGGGYSKKDDDGGAYKHNDSDDDKKKKKKKDKYQSDDSDEETKRGYGGGYGGKRNDSDDDRQGHKASGYNPGYAGRRNY